MSKPSKSGKNDLDAIFAALPDNKKAARKWTLQEDAMILKYAESKGISAIARVLDVERATVNRRYAFLKAQSNGK